MSLGGNLFSPEGRAVSSELVPPSNSPEDSLVGVTSSTRELKGPHQATLKTELANRNLTSSTGKGGCS